MATVDRIKEVGSDFVLGNFLLIFSGSFFITLFVLMMQFTWRYVDGPIGKGITMDILGQFWQVYGHYDGPDGRCRCCAAGLADLLWEYGRTARTLGNESCRRFAPAYASACRARHEPCGGLYFQNRAAAIAQKNLTSLL